MNRRKNPNPADLAQTPSMLSRSIKPAFVTPTPAPAPLPKPKMMLLVRPTPLDPKKQDNTRSSAQQAPYIYVVKIQTPSPNQPAVANAEPIGDDTNRLQVPGKKQTPKPKAKNGDAKLNKPTLGVPDDEPAPQIVDAKLNKPTLGVPNDEPAPQIVDAPKGKRIGKYSKDSHWQELSLQRNREVGCCSLFSNKQLLAELNLKIEIWEENEKKLRYMSLGEQQTWVNKRYNQKKAEIALRNFADDPTGTILKQLKSSLRNYINDNKRSQRNTQLSCKYQDKKDDNGVERTSVAVGPTRQKLLSKLQTDLRDPNSEASILDIINEWKLAKTIYKKPNSEAFFTNYDFISEKTGWSEPTAKKLIDKYTTLLELAKVKSAPKP